MLADNKFAKALQKKAKELFIRLIDCDKFKFICKTL